MSRTSITTLVVVTLAALGTACWLYASDSQAKKGAVPEAYQRPKVWPKPTDPPPASPIYHDLDEPVPGEADIERDVRGLNAWLERETESAILSGDPQRWEYAMVFLLPELLQVEPVRVTALLARLKAGKVRDTFRDEVARLWTSQDLRAAMGWMKTLEGADRRAAVIEGVLYLAPIEPGQAVMLAGAFELSRDESLRKLLGSLPR
jgi:hypothetical protein